MRPRHFIASVGLTLLSMFFAASSAEAVVCARGVVRAGCVGPNGAIGVGPAGAAAVRTPRVVTCRWVNGVKVCR
jgi:hypothetical protein